MRFTILLLSIVILSCANLSFVHGQNRPNILVLLADDMGADAFAAYNIGADLPNTPNLNRLASEGLLFMNAWSHPTCAPSRAALLTGRYGNKNGIIRSGPNMSNDEVTLFEHVSTVTEDEYANALFGKWHLGNANSPNNQGIDQYEGNISSGVDDYYRWYRNLNGVSDTLESYVTTHLTDQAITWVDQQSEPWLLWMAYNAPHSPLHLPPDSLYTRTQTTSNFDKYLCMIESVDHEVGRLYDSLTEEEKENTLIVFMGDNGTPNGQLQAYPRRHGKGTVYEGGIRVPMFVTGHGVSRVNEKETALVSFTDLFATITEVLGVEVEGGLDNSFSFFPMLTDSNAPKRRYNYSEIEDGDLFRAIRNDQYKLVISSAGTQEFYDLSIDSLEENELIATGLSTEQMVILEDLQSEADSIFTSWSCRDGILNGTEEGIDCGVMTYCGSCTTLDIEILVDDCGITIYPNPTENDLTIQLESGSYSINIRDTNGTLHNAYQVAGTHTIGINELPSGLYFLEIFNQNENKVYLSQVIKQ